MSRLVALCLIGLAACSGTRTVVNEVVFAARDGNHKPLQSVVVKLNGKAAGNTNANGDLAMRLTGPVGASFAVEAACPTPYESPRGLPRLVLTEFAPVAGRNANLLVQITCEQPLREVAILVRARTTPRLPLQRHKHRTKPPTLPPLPVPDLPLVHKGQVVARTDMDGLAHLSLSTLPGDRLELVLDTSSPAFANLKPRSPSLTVEVTAEDNLYVLEPMFSDDLAPPPTPQRHPRHFIKFYEGGAQAMVQLHKGHSSKRSSR